MSESRDFAAFSFNKDYKDREQVRHLMPAYLDRYDELVADGKYPYDASFVGYLGSEWATPRDEETAIYLCQTLRRLDALAAKVAGLLAIGYTELTEIAAPTKFSRVVLWGWQNGESGYAEWDDARVVPGENGKPKACLPKGKRTNGADLRAGHVLVKA